MIRSFTKTPREKAPVNSNRKLSGTLNHVLPRPMATAMSVEPIPVEKAAEGAARARVGIRARRAPRPGRTIDSAIT